MKRNREFVSEKGIGQRDRLFLRTGVTAVFMTLALASCAAPPRPFVSASPSPTATLSPTNSPAVCRYLHPPEGEIPEGISITLTLSTTSTRSYNRKLWMRGLRKDVAYPSFDHTMVEGRRLHAGRKEHADAQDSGRRGWAPGVRFVA